jgi:hydrogen peroxide-dependent heme synthase
VNEPLHARQGWGVLHLFCRLTPLSALDDVAAAAKSAVADDLQVVPFSVFGHKADLGFLAIGADWVRLRQFQAGLAAAGLEVIDSYLSLTEVSEYAGDLPPERTEPRLHPVLPPEGKRAFCFYPMTKRRGEVNNWYTLDFERRKELMFDHGRSGRRFAGRIVQLITGSTGLDDFEWGVSLFGEHPDDLKETVYTMRYDEASALYGEFGTFYTGIAGTVEEVAAQVGLV